MRTKGFMECPGGAPNLQVQTTLWLNKDVCIFKIFISECWSGVACLTLGQVWGSGNHEYNFRIHAATTSGGRAFVLVWSCTCSYVGTWKLIQILCSAWCVGRLWRWPTSRWDIDHIYEYRTCKELYAGLSPTWSCSPAQLHLHPLASICIWRVLSTCCYPYVWMRRCGCCIDP